jgi:hypothetical protein
MDEQNLNRRQWLGGMAVTAGTAGLLGVLDVPAAKAADASADATSTRSIPRGGGCRGESGAARR